MTAVAAFDNATSPASIQASLVWADNAAGLMVLCWQAPGKDINHSVDMSTGHKLLHIVVFFLVVTTPLTVLVVLFFSMRHVLQQYGCACVLNFVRAGQRGDGCITSVSRLFC